MVCHSTLPQAYVCEAAQMHVYRQIKTKIAGSYPLLLGCLQQLHEVLL